MIANAMTIIADNFIFRNVERIVFNRIGNGDAEGGRIQPQRGTKGEGGGRKECGEGKRNLGLMGDGGRGQNGGEDGGMVPSAEMRDNSRLHLM